MIDKKKKSHQSHFIIIFIFWCISISTFAQVSTGIRGVIFDSSTKEPIPYATISFEGTSIGVFSDDDGRFSLSNKNNKNVVSVKLIGYETQKVILSVGKTINKDIFLVSEDKLLNEVIVKPKKEKYSKKNNPAVDLIKKVIEHKKGNNITAQDYYQYKEYERYIFAFNEFNPESRQFKKYKFLPNYVDSSMIDKKAILPFSVKEKVSDVFFRGKPKTEKKIVKGYKTAGIDQGLEQQGIEAFIQEAFKDVSIFDNYITLLLNNFVGPLSDHQAVSFYRWYMADTVTIDNERFAQLDFAPFNSRDIGFTGHLYISTDSTYAVRRAILKAPKNINVNFVSDLIIQHDFQKDENGVWVPQEYRTAMDMSIYDALKLYVEKTIAIEDFVANLPISPVYDLPDPEMHEKDYLKRPQDFWEKNRPIAHQTDYKMEELVDEMKDVFIVKLILNLGNILMTGYVPLDKNPEINKLEIGTVPTFYSYNPVEGSRFRTTLTTTKNFHPHLFLYGYGAYGTKDNTFKYAGEATWAFGNVKSHKEEFPRNNLTFAYKYDMNTLGQKYTQAERDNIIFSLSRSNNVRMTYNRQSQISYQREYHNGFSFKLLGQSAAEKAAGKLVFAKQDEFGGITDVDKIQTTEATINLRYAHNEKFFQQRRRRIPIPTETFIIDLSHTTAFKDFLGGKYNYNKTSLSLHKDLWVTPYGKLSLHAQGDKLWGEAPFPYLISPSSNNSFTLQSGSFYLVDPLEFIHDTQVSWEVYYHLGGWLFNRIPLLRELKWREVFGFRGFYGTLSDKNNPMKNHDQILFPERSFSTYDRTPYMEYNIGIENIFNFFRIDYVRRINYLDHPDISKDGIRFSFQMDF